LKNLKLHKVVQLLFRDGAVLEGTVLEGAVLHGSVFHGGVLHTKK
jgi:hypothetical protein